MGSYQGYSVVGHELVEECQRIHAGWRRQFRRLDGSIECTIYESQGVLGKEARLQSCGSG
jgi:hypothetical protein